MNGHTSKTKNASVELLRFLFTSIIIFFHINLDLWDQKKVIAVVREIPVTFFKHGNIGVEFFFLVTGWLMAKTIYTKYIQPRESGVNTGGAIPVESADARKSADTGKRPAGKAGRGRLMEGTVQFVRHKANAIFPYYLLACALTVVIQFLTERTLSLDYFLRRLPSLFFLQRMGFGKPFIGCTWYLSSMLLALFVVYPLCRRFYHVFTLAAAPLLCAVLLGAIIICTGSLGNIEDWFFITYKTNIRAFAEISLGATAFEISRRMQGHVHSRAGRILLSFIALACLFLSLVQRRGSSVSFRHIQSSGFYISGKNQFTHVCDPDTFQKTYPLVFPQEHTVDTVPADLFWNFRIFSFSAGCLCESAPPTCSVPSSGSAVPACQKQKPCLRLRLYRWGNAPDAEIMSQGECP